MGGFFININVDNLFKMSFIYLATNIENNKRYNRMMFQKKLIGAYNCTEYEKAR